MLKRWLLIFLFLALPALGNVAQDDGTVQVGDPDAQGSTAPVVSSSASPGQAPAAPVPVEAPGNTGSGSGSVDSHATGPHPGPDGQVSGAHPGPDDLQRQLEAPMPMESPYTLIAVGILLLLLALLGGVYFYRNRDREESAE